MASNLHRVHVQKSILLAMVLVVIVITVEFYLWNLPANTNKMASAKVPRNSTYSWKTNNKENGNGRVIHLATVICGNRLEEGITMLKSAAIFSKSQIVFHIFTEDVLREGILDELNSWPLGQLYRMTVTLYDPYFPTVKPCPGCMSEDWSNLFAPCAAQRLFFPEILPDIDSLIYVDSDTLFLSPVEEVWAHFYNFTPSQIQGIMVELSGWYVDKTFPYCSDTGVNSGIILMNLTRMRPAQWTKNLVKHYGTYKQELTLWDQDLINIYCHFHPDQIYIMSCSWNYRGTFCAAHRPCNETETLGAYILHGNSHVFHNDIYPAIKAVYKSFKEHDLTFHTIRDLYNSMVYNMKRFADTDCGQKPHLFTRNVEKYMLANERTNGG